jgi:hypothetical protein
MENTFTTTFIPKKPIVPETSGPRPTSRPVGLLSTISTILFFVAIICAIGVYVWEQYETQESAKLSASITLVEKSFEPELITQLQSLDTQLKTANTVLSGHTVVTPIFNVLASSTLPKVQFTKMSLVDDPTTGMAVSMSGVADSYQTIAQESDVLGSTSAFKNVLFSNFVLTQSGQISFDLSFSVDPSIVNFSTAPLAAPAAPDSSGAQTFALPQTSNTSGTSSGSGNSASGSSH